MPSASTGGGGIYFNLLSLSRLFITHCGMHGVLESVFYSVPMLGMPVFIDQSDVLARIEDRGVGRGISKFATADEIHRGILAVRDDEK